MLSKKLKYPPKAQGISKLKGGKHGLCESNLACGECKDWVEPLQ